MFKFLFIGVSIFFSSENPGSGIRVSTLENIFVKVLIPLKGVLKIVQDL